MAILWPLVIVGLVRADTPELGVYNINESTVTVSGFSAGAAFANQMHIAYSSFIQGAGMFTSTPYLCAQGLGFAALSACFNFPSLIDVDWLEAKARELASQDRIDSLDNVKDSRVYIQAGQYDYVVRQGTSPKTSELYSRFDADIKTVYDVPTAHVIPTVDTGDDCSLTGDPMEHFGACNYNGAKNLLEYLLGDLQDGVKDLVPENFVRFNQRPFADDKYGLYTDGIIYVPTSCANGTKCHLHVHFHGAYCAEEFLGANYYAFTDLNEIAEANDIIVLYPQIKTTSVNLIGSWDVWGYNSLSLDLLKYATKDGRQMKAIMQMINKMMGSYEGDDWDDVEGDDSAVDLDDGDDYAKDEDEGDDYAAEGISSAENEAQNEKEENSSEDGGTTNEDEDDDDDSCDTQVKLVPVYLIVILFLASIAGIVCAKLKKDDKKQSEPKTAEESKAQSCDATDIRIVLEDFPKLYSFPNATKTQSEIFAERHLVLRCMHSSTVSGISKISTLLAVLLLQMFIAGAVIVLLKLEEEDFSNQYLLPVVVSTLLSGLVSVCMVISGDKLQVSLPIIVVALAGIGGVISTCCTLGWPVAFLLASSVELSVVETIVARYKL